jgi:hypothetical protein
LNWPTEASLVLVSMMCGSACHRWPWA